MKKQYFHGLTGSDNKVSEPITGLFRKFVPYKCRLGPLLPMSVAVRATGPNIKCLMKNICRKAI